MHASPSTCRSGPLRTHGIMARLMRLAAGVLFATLVVAAFTALSQATASTNRAAEHHCIFDKMQQRHLQAVARQRLAPSKLSPIGLPYVSTVAAAVGAGTDNAASSATSATPTTTAPTTIAGSSSPDVTRSTEWGHFRITMSTADLTDPAYHCSTVGQVINNRDGATVTCTEDDILTDAKRDILENYLIPQALQLHTDRLQVQQVQDTWKVTGMAGDTCGDFKVPAEHLTTGLSNTDFVVYVGSVPSWPGVLAWATTCQVFSNDQPAVGVINIPAAFIADRYDQYMIHTVAHEIAHTLGFSDTFFTYSGMGQMVTGIRGKDYAAPVINSTTVVAKTREHYGCDTAEYMELEDAGGSGTLGSHWKIRNAQDELMAGVAGVGYYTALTLSAFEDLGYYKANYSNAETMKWGSNAGCSFLDGKCVIDNVTQFPSMYCDTNETVFRCQPARLNLGSCGLANYSAALPTYFQYFTVPSVGGRSQYYDYCPYIARWGFGSCTQVASQATANVSSFNTFSMSSRCIDGSFTPKTTGGATVTAYLGMCSNLMCNTANHTYSIQVYGHDAYIPCTPGATVDLATYSDAFEAGGYVTCPPYLEVCQSNVQAAIDYQSTVSTGSASSDSTSSGSAQETTTTPVAPSASSASTNSDNPTSSPNPVAPSASSDSTSSGSAQEPTPTRDGNAAAHRTTTRTAAMALLALAVAAVCV